MLFSQNISAKTKTIFIIIFVVFSLLSKAQNYIEYTKIKYKAQDCILDEKFIDAQAYYDTLLNNYDFVYALDCFNALKVAITNNDITASQKFLLKGLEMGIPVETVNEDVYIKKNLKFDLWTGIQQNSIDSLYSIYDKRINKDLQKRIEAMDLLDDIATNKVNKSYVLYYFKWRRVARKNAQELKEIIKTYGFPSEKLIGIYQYYYVNGEKKFTSYPSRGNAENMLIHYFSYREKDWKEYIKLLRGQIESGNLRPEAYGCFWDFYSKWKWTKRHGFQLHYNCWHIDPNHVRLVIVNTVRNEIGLPDYHTYGLKAGKNWFNVQRNGLYDSKILWYEL